MIDEPRATSVPAVTSDIYPTVLDILGIEVEDQIRPLDGISLTVGEVGESTFAVYLIPHTLEVTTLGDREVGVAVYVETDILGKYVERMLAARSGEQGRGVSRAMLEDHGYA